MIKKYQIFLEELKITKDLTTEEAFRNTLKETYETVFNYLFR